MAYTPELSIKYSAILRRLAWAINQPMTHVLNMVIESAVERISKDMVCQQCRDKTKCDICAFNH